MGLCTGCTDKGGFIYNVVQSIRWVPVIFVTAILGWAYYAYVYQLCINTVDNNLQRVLYLLGFHILLTLFVWSYLRTVFAKLQQPPHEFFIPHEVMQELHACGEDEARCSQILLRYATHGKLPLRMRGYDGGIRYCPKCVCIKPDRSHHCSICGQCVLKFDHHCPWVNTCVNFHNYKFFLLFLGYGLALCVYAFFTDLPYFIHFWQHDIQDRNIVVGKFHMLFLFFVSGMFAISLGALFFYHLFLTARNRTTVESFRAPMLTGGPDSRAFDMGTKANYRQIFGVQPMLWFLPVYSSIGDGWDHETAGAACCPDLDLPGFSDGPSHNAPRTNAAATYSHENGTVSYNETPSARNAAFGQDHDRHVLETV